LRFFSICLASAAASFEDAAGSALHLLPVQLSFQRLDFDLPARAVMHDTHGAGP
jgi:hypothetical protein